MNTTSTFTATGRHLVHTIGLAALTVPLAAALTVGAGTAAHADEPVRATVVHLDADPTWPGGPGDLTTEEDCQQTDTCGPGGGEGGDPDDGGDPSDGDEPSDGGEIDTPTSIDAGASSTSDAGWSPDWALSGGLLVSAAGLALAARRRRTAAHH